MTVLVLSPYPERLDDALKGETRSGNPDWVISFGHREILTPEFLAAHNCINIHISFLPYNRGADPNFWSWFDDTPKGVSIHQMTKGIDTGPIYARSLVNISPDETLASSYEILMGAAVAVFKRAWPFIRDGRMPALKQPKEGTYHRAADKDRWIKLYNGWDTPCSAIKSLGEAHRHFVNQSINPTLAA